VVNHHIWVDPTHAIVEILAYVPISDRLRVEEDTMALFMDTHTIEGGVSASDVAQAHRADLETQEKYGVRYLRYWVDENAGKIFCLVEADDAESANTVHREAHGLVADEIFPVSEYS
jgi:hypothetical protein